MYLINTFFKVSGRDGWLLIYLWYVFYMTLFLKNFFLHFLITEYDDSLRAVYESLTYRDPLLPKWKVYLSYRLIFSIFPAWQAQNNLKCIQHSRICAERNRTFQQIVVVLQLPLFCIHCKNIRSSEIACSPVVPLNLKSLPTKLITGRQRGLKRSDILPVY